MQVRGKALPGKLDIKRHPPSILYVWFGAWSLFCGLFLRALTKFNKHLTEEERAGYFTLIVLYLSVFCVRLFLMIPCDDLRL